MLLNIMKIKLLGLVNILVEKVLAVIAEQSTSGTKITHAERRFLVSRFPYGIIYSANKDQMTIFAVMNLKRKPGYWKSRI